LGDFLTKLGDRIGVDLAGAAENLGLDKFAAPRNNEEVDFEPRTDIFDTSASYVVHLSLPGAKKQDIGVDWDGENSVLRITGVVHRPGVDEQLLSQLVVNGRKRENGVFEKAIRLGTKRDPANVDVAGITAKMTDGVLVVKVPKVDREIHKREVPISGSASPSAARQEADLLFDADEEMYDAAPEPNTTVQDAPATPLTANKLPTEAKDKEDEVRDDRSVTVGREEEQLPRYEAEETSTNDNASDWEKDSDEEADYVKINVD
jgi:HSP20 family molecular chaperone IbpA